MSLQYVLYDYWDYGYAEGDAILEFGSASVTAEAIVSAVGTRIKFFSADVSANAILSAVGTRIQFGNAAITANAIFTADGTRVRTNSASITGAATVSALGGVIYSATADINGVASVTAYPNAIWSAYAAVNANATVIANGDIIGGEWSDSAISVDSWTSVPTVSNIWTPVGSGSINWSINRPDDPYVVIDYWVDGYTDDRYDFWIKSSNGTNNWVRQ